MSSFPPDPPPDLTPHEVELLAELEGPVAAPRQRPPSRPKRPRPRVVRADGKAKGSPKPKGRELGALARQKRCVSLRVAGRKYADIGEELGISATTARKSVERWINAQKPSEEQTAELRLIMQGRLEELHEAYWKYAKGWTTPRGVEIAPDPKAGEFLLKVLERHARLMGVDMQPETTTLLISAESVARFLGWDSDAAGGDVIDVPPGDIRELPPAHDEEDAA